MPKTSGSSVFPPAIPVVLVLAFLFTGSGCSDDHNRAASDGSPPALDGSPPALDGSPLDGHSEAAAGGFHTLGSPTPATCLPCHAGDAPTGAAGWISQTYTRSPFDYGTNSLGFRHGAAQDCAFCHAGPGTGAWGMQPNWVGGHFAHETSPLVGATCIACHVSQRPDLQPGETPATAAAKIAFDHAPVAALDCIGCHWATVAAETYVNYLNPATGTLPGGDWKGGQSYPGSTPVGFPGEHIELVATTLTLSEANDMVTGVTVAYEDLPDIMIHTAASVPPELRPGPTGAPDYGKCWHCHFHKNGVVTMFPMGKYHGPIEQYSVTPDAPVTPLPQPTSGCRECHAVTEPVGIVATSSLRPMKHGAEFASPATVAGVPVTGVKDLECSTCHDDPTGVFRNAAFHSNTSTARPKDCLGCHYLTMADGPTADVQSGTTYRMRHASPQVTFQTCTTCHPSALASATNPTPAAEDWKPGYYHAVLPAQPAACNDCHLVSVPPVTLVAFDHSGVTGDVGSPDCADCHAFPGTGTAATPNWLGATKSP
jgi:hypothetical protein